MLLLKRQDYYILIGGGFQGLSWRAQRVFGEWSQILQVDNV